MSVLNQWAIQWGVPAAALADLMYRMGAAANPLSREEVDGASESSVQARIRTEAAQKGMWLGRNNVGALQNDEGRWIRFGLANDSSKTNEVMKSGDLIGIRPVPITLEHVGSIFGQFVSREVKEAGWRYTGNGREPAQLNWIKFITARGGDAAFATGPGTL